MKTINRLLKRVLARFVPDNTRLIESLQVELASLMRQNDPVRRDYVERHAELAEARALAGPGPWGNSLAFSPGGARLRESASSTAAFADLELALESTEWRREVQLSWLEFSRWGIQQIILIARLYYIKNPMIQRGINVSSYYVFGRGVEISSPDEAANETIQKFLDRNSKELGQIGLVEKDRALFTDGNVFFVFFTALDTGETNVRSIDATEVCDIITDPDDSSIPRFYRRKWSQDLFDETNGATRRQDAEAWYPAINYEPADKPSLIGGKPVMWDTPIYHMKDGGLSKWKFGCPRVYAALDWARESRKNLERYASIQAALAQIAMKISTKGGQQALAGIKNAMNTTVGPNAGIGGALETNPPAVAGGTFASGPGTTLEAFKSKGSIDSPDEGRRMWLMVAMVFGLPETFFGDASVGTLATAASLDRPTELKFMEAQERWRETIVTIIKYVLGRSLTASSGFLRNAKRESESVSIMEAPRKRSADGMRLVEISQKADPKTIVVSVKFPAILEHDVTERVGAITTAMTLGNKLGTIVGIDKKTGVSQLLSELDVEDYEQIVDDMEQRGAFPDDLTPPDPQEQPVQAPIAKAKESKLVMRIEKLWEKTVANRQ